VRQLVLAPVPRARHRHRTGSRALAAVALAGAAIAAGVFSGTLGSGTPEQQHRPPQRVVVAIADTPVVGEPIVQPFRPPGR
jgi:anti-sigma factor RsiW